MRLTITGTPDLSPDCTVEDTGEPAGQHNGQDYWTWEAGGKTWYLFVTLSKPERWGIVENLDGSGARWGGPLSSELVTGDYSPSITATGTVTVAEYVPPAPVSGNKIDIRVAHLLTCHQCGARINRSYAFHQEEFDATE